MARKRRYTDKQVQEAVKTSKSIAEVLRKLELRAAGGNFATIQRKIVELQLDTSHFTGQLWNKNLQLKDYTEYTRGKYVKIHLIHERGHRCESCKLTKWLDQPIPLELHHIDGSRFNNEKENLQLLCSNCHAQTDTFKNKKRGLGVIGSRA